MWPRHRQAVWLVTNGMDSSACRLCIKPLAAKTQSHASRFIAGVLLHSTSILWDAFAFAISWFKTSKHPPHHLSPVIYQEPRFNLYETFSSQTSSRRKKHPLHRSRPFAGTILLCQTILANTTMRVICRLNTICWESDYSKNEMHNLVVYGSIPICIACIQNPWLCEGIP